MASAQSENRICANCGVALRGEFCAQCGQRSRAPNPSVWGLVKDFGYELTDVDGRVLRSLKALVLSPGHLTHEYILGRRAAWLPPIRLYLVVSLIYFAVSALTGEAGPDIDISVTGDSEEDVAAELAELGYDSAAELDDAVAQAAATWMPRIMFVLMPIFAGLVQLAHLGSGHNYPRHLIFSLHAHSAWFIVFAMLGLGGYVAGGETVDTVLNFVAIAFALFYLVLAFQLVYRDSWPRALAKGIVVGVIYGVVTIVMTGAVVGSVVFSAG